MDASVAKRIRSIFLVVYVAISIATFYHTSWGFGTLAGAMPPQGDYVGTISWWLVGGLSAFSIDVGMGAIVFAILSGWEARWLIWSLVVLALFSAFAQLVFASNHAYGYAMGVVPVWLGWLEYVLDARTLILPLALPIFSLVYAFAAKINPNKLPDAVISDLEETVSLLEDNLRKSALRENAYKAEIEDMKNAMKKTNGSIRYVDFGRAIANNTDINVAQLTALARELDVNPSYMVRGYNQIKNGDSE